MQALVEEHHLAGNETGRRLRGLVVNPQIHVLDKQSLDVYFPNKINVLDPPVLSEIQAVT